MSDVSLEGDSVGNGISKGAPQTRIYVVVGFGGSRSGHVDGKNTLVAGVRQDTTGEVWVDWGDQFGR